MKITLITLCKNEEILLPFFIRHYAPIVDEIHMFDNGSTDRSLEIAKTCSKIKVIPFDTGGVIRDDVYLKIKNEHYKKLDADWYIVADMDEFLYHKDLRKRLEEYTAQGITMPKTYGYNMIGTDVPIDDGVTPLTQLLNMGVITDTTYVVGPDFMGSYSKRAMFHKSITGVNYMPGCHECFPTGNVRISATAEILMLHYKWLSRDYGSGVYKSWKLSPENQAAGFGVIDLNLRLSYYDKQLPLRARVPGL